MGLTNRVGKNNCIGIDLRSEMYDFLDDYGYHIIYMRLNRHIHCPCWDETNHEATKTHDLCLGTGYKIIQFERHLTRNVEKKSVRSMIDFAEQEPGHIFNPVDVFYFKYTVQPIHGDMLFQVLFDDYDGKIKDVIMAYQIEHSRMKVQDSGIVSHYEVDCRGTNTDLDFYNNFLRKVNYKVID